MNWTRISLILCTTLVVWSAANIHWGGQHHQGIIKADGRGYYAHLPAIFIYQDLNFGHYDSIEQGRYFNENYNYDYRKTYNGHVLNKYFSGTALAMLPFFAIGHGVSLISDWPADGYSKYYQLSISLAAICYLIATMMLMVKFLKCYNFHDVVIALTIPVMLFGSNWYYYVVSEPAMSHVYSIFFITCWMYCMTRWAISSSVNVYWLAIITGMIILIRPVNGIVLLSAPAFFKDWKHFIRSINVLLSVPKKWILPVISGLAILSIQPIIYKIQTGNFLVYAYEEEGFNFLQPHFLDILFSYKKGLFVYTPLLLISLIGLVMLYRNNRYQASWTLIFLVSLTYVLSSWWNWYYGGSFSSRAFIEYYLLFAWLLAFLIQFLMGLVKWKRLIGFSIILLLVAYCQLQTFQYRHMMIHWDGMTAEQYWNIFLKLPD